MGRYDTATYDTQYLPGHALSMPTLTSAINERAYDAIAGRWDENRRDFYGRERDYLDALLAGLPRGTAVLDLGCGTGRPMADHVISRGFHVIGVDRSGAMLAIARSRHPAEVWLQASIEDVVIDSPHGAAILWDSLFHIERGRHEAILGRVLRGLPARGRLMMTVGGSAHPPFTDTMFGETFFYDSNTPDETMEMLDRLGCRVLVAEFMNVPDGGRDKGRYAIVAEKR